MVKYCGILRNEEELTRGLSQVETMLSGLRLCAAANHTGYGTLQYGFGSERDPAMRDQRAAYPWARITVPTRRCRNMLDHKQLLRIIETALAEDVNTGDITTSATVPPCTHISGRFLAKGQGVLCGADVVRAVFAYVDGGIALRFHCSDGDALEFGDVIADISGEAASILTGERVALNLLQHMSGIATRTRETVNLVRGYDVKILDTRKTTPGLRMLGKYAVRVGGGHNHRFSLSDGILIKDNHIQAAGGITNASAQRAATLRLR